MKGQKPPSGWEMRTGGVHLRIHARQRVSEPRGQRETKSWSVSGPIWLEVIRDPVSDVSQHILFRGSSEGDPGFWDLQTRKQNAQKSLMREFELSPPDPTSYHTCPSAIHLKDGILSSMMPVRSRLSRALIDSKKYVPSVTPWKTQT